MFDTSASVSVRAPKTLVYIVRGGPQKFLDRKYCDKFIHLPNSEQMKSKSLDSNMTVSFDSPYSPQDSSIARIAHIIPQSRLSHQNHVILSPIFR